MLHLEHLSKYAVFCSSHPNSGNPALVLDTAEQNLAEFQAYAKAENFPILVCLVPAEKDSFPKIRFFYPNYETNICVHGALAAAEHLLNGKSSKVCTVINKDNEALHLSKEQDRVFITLNPVPPLDKAFNEDEVLSLLGIDDSDLDLSLPFKIASAGSPKVLIPVADLSILGELKPQFDHIAKWSQENAVKGFYVYTAETEDKSADFHARNFNPLSGLDEDVATGIAAAALVSCFVELNPTRKFRIEQGLFLQKPCLIYVQWDGDRLKVGGNVTKLGGFSSGR